ncbi:hypothetical protein GYA49_02630 [Candidatus Beckwithbacteria bacterium]|nr:hypothetical protein [Candidatus Beckwithbacteria bacterium]
MHSYLLSGFPLSQAKTKIIALAGIAITPDQLETHPDITWVKPEINTKTTTQKASIKIEIIRQLPQIVNKKPFELPKQLCIIDQAQTMTTASQNALLKILEEPGEDTLFFLLTSNHQQLLATIQSRCQVLIAGKTGKQDLDFETIWQELISLHKQTIGQRLSVINNYSKDRNSAQQWLASTIYTLRWQLQQNSSDSPINLTVLLKNLIKGQQDIAGNVNIKLVLDQLMIAWDQEELDLEGF